MHNRGAIGHGVQRPEQKEFQMQVEALGFKYYIVRSLEEFKSIVECEIKK